MKKKFLIPIFLTIILAVLLANHVYEQYQETVFKTEEENTVYFLQQGVYTKKENIQDIKPVHITVEEDQKYYTYIGMSTSYENALKVKEYYENQNIPIYIKDQQVNNKEFLSSLSQYDILLESSKTEEIPNILETILSTYEQIFLNN